MVFKSISEGFLGFSMIGKKTVKRWRSIKDKTPIIGIDDGGFNRFSDEFNVVPVYGVIMKGAAYVDGIIQCQVKKDDPHANVAISRMILESSHKNQLQAIFLQGITIGGFGVLDIIALSEELTIPVIVILRKFLIIPKFVLHWKKPSLMIQKDGRDPKEIEKVIIWCQQDLFWQNNILSTSKLREQYDQLALKKQSSIEQSPPYYEDLHENSNV